MQHPFAVGLLGAAVAILYAYFLGITVFGGSNSRRTNGWTSFWALRMNRRRLDRKETAVL